MNVNDKAALTVAIDEFDEFFAAVNHGLSLIHISEPTRLSLVSRMPSSA